MTSELVATSWKPHSYQQTGVVLMIKQACAGLLYKPGRGKTSVVYMAFRILQDKGYVKKMLVICPLRPAYVVWPEQKNKYLEFKHFRVNILHGDDKEDLLNDDDADIYVVNPEGLPWLFGVNSQGIVDKARARWVANKFQMLAVDESTKFQDTSTKRFKIIRQVVGMFKRRYIMTGSFRPKNLLGLFGQVYLMDEGAHLGRYITHYRNKYFYPGGYGGYDWIPHPNSAEEIAEKIAPLVQVVDRGKDEPELFFNDVWIDLDPVSRAKYNEMEERMMLDIAEGRVVAANAAVASSKCRQICNGAIYTGENEEWEPVHDLKIKAVEELLEELNGDPALITYEFKFDRERLEKKFNFPCISTGNISKDRDAIQKFSRGETVTVIGQPQSVALGTDGLQDSCHDIIMMGCPWSFLNYEQVIDRIRRQGNKSPHVTVHRILCRGTVDERVVKVLEGNDRSQAAFLKMLEELRK